MKPSGSVRSVFNAEVTTTNAPFLKRKAVFVHHTEFTAALVREVVEDSNAPAVVVLLPADLANHESYNAAVSIPFINVFCDGSAESL
jgi:hypothetical protein